MTDVLQQYHMLEDFTNANCMAHARRNYADAIKAIGKRKPAVVKASLTYQALEWIRTIYKIEGSLANLAPVELLYERQKSISPLIDEYFTWIKARLADTEVLPKGKIAKGLNYSINQVKYLRVFLTDRNVPIDNFVNVLFAPSVWAKRAGCS